MYAHIEVAVAFLFFVSFFLKMYFVHNSASWKSPFETAVGQHLSYKYPGAFQTYQDPQTSWENLLTLNANWTTYDSILVIFLGGWGVFLGAFGEVFGGVSRGSLRYFAGI